MDPLGGRNIHTSHFHNDGIERATAHEHYQKSIANMLLIFKDTAGGWIVH